ncbi:hypothetical protein [Halorarius litoreus]|uniref:hypothetical protein n=1 Tax=Halorarius litoreus TaxID=2962676 RepID=UPI0020CFC1A7|nr:hypothetical protein [Halorarius litoreus]
MSDHVTAGLLLFVYLGLLGLSPLVPFTVWTAGRFGRSQRRTLAAWVVVPAALSLLLGAGLLVLSARFALDVAGQLLVGLLVLWGLPLGLGVGLLDRRGTAPQAAALLAAIGLPVGLALSFLVFLAPGGFYRYNITFLTGPAAWLAWSAFLAAVVLLPVALAVALERTAVGRRLTRRAR